MARRVLHDTYFKQAKAKGYRSRAAFKLLQINESKHIIKHGDAVLDLGCAPGAWIQIALKLAGETGAVVGLDLKPTEPVSGGNSVSLVGDAFETDPRMFLDALKEISTRERFDVVVSDMAPATGGHGDAERSTHLCRRVLELCPHVLRPAGSLTMKVLEGREYQDLLRETRGKFASVKGFKPKASRDVSREMYVIATGLKSIAEGGMRDMRQLPPHLRFSEDEVQG